MEVQENLKSVQQHIQKAAQKVGRMPEEVTLVAVSKTKPLSLIQEVFEAGQQDFGENKAQEFRDKQAEMPSANWHFIGHLQRNKVKYIIEDVQLIHSLDSERLMAEINKQAAKIQREVSCLLQLNISEEDSKFGLNERTGREVLAKIDEYEWVRIVGLMGMAEHSDEEQVIREQFQRLRRAFQAYKNIEHPRIQMKELSMGMSHDFELAIEEGSTMVRVGSAIFGARNYNT